MKNLLEYGVIIILQATGSVGNYCRDKINDDENETNSLRNRLSNNNTIRNKPFEYRQN